MLMVVAIVIAVVGVLDWLMSSVVSRRRSELIRRGASNTEVDQAGRQARHYRRTSALLVTLALVIGLAAWFTS